jgi:hypothetical protein
MKRGVVEPAQLEIKPVGQVEQDKQIDYILKP